MSNEVMLREDTEESGFVTAEVFLSPLPGIEPMRVKARVGSLVRDILPAEARAPMVCLIDGVPMKREWWMERPVCEGDRIQFAPVYLGGGGGSKGILGAIAMIALTYIAPYISVGVLGEAVAGTVANLSFVGSLFAAGVVLVGNALISAVIGTPSGSVGQGDVASSIYSVDTQGNAARIFQPIPVQYGRVKYYPNYAAQPYSEYFTEDPGISEVVVPIILKSGEASGKDHSNGEQYYYALFCLGQGEYDIHNISIADATLYNKDAVGTGNSGPVFSDVIVSNILEPGEKPKYVNPCVVTSDAVSGMSLDDGNWVGPFPACGPGRRVSRVDLDFVFPQGLCKLNDEGKAKEHSVQITVSARAIDKYGNATSSWVSFTEVFKASSLTPQRRTIRYKIDNPDLHTRWELKVMRIGARDKEDNRTMDSVQWGALRGYIVGEAPLCSTATHYELVMRASEQLSSLSQRKISVIATRKLPSWDNATPTATKSPARALYDKWTNTVYGDGMPIDRIDVDVLRQMDALCEERGDEFNYVFENRVSSQEADQTIAKSFRAVALQRQGVKTVVRDELCDMPLTLFNPTNIAEKSVSLDYVQITEETTDGVIVEFFNDVTWDWQEIECPGPGRTYSDPSNAKYNPALPVMENPARITLNGITKGLQAEREGLYYAYTNALRRQFATWTTELQGALVYYGAPVLLSTTLYASQQGGEIRDYDGDVMQLTNGVRAGKLVLMRNDGSLTEPMDFTIVDPDTNSIRLHGTPDFTVNYGDYASERTKYIILEGEMIRRIVKILSITPKGLGESGAPMYELKGVVDVPEVHLVGNDLVGIVDPYTPPDPQPDDPTPVVPVPSGDYVIKMRAIDYQFLGSHGSLYPNTGWPPEIALYPDGALRTFIYNMYSSENPVMLGAVPGNEQVWNHWVEGAPIQNVGSLYEVMFLGHWGTWGGFQGFNFAITKPSPLGGATVPDDSYLNNPERPYMQGHKLHYAGSANLSSTQINADDMTALTIREFTAKIRESVSYDAPNEKHVVYTDWIPMDNEVHLRSWWRTQPLPYYAGNIFNADSRYFAVAIRDKATHTLQQLRQHLMGYYVDPGPAG